MFIKGGTVVNDDRCGAFCTFRWIIELTVYRQFRADVLCNNGKIIAVGLDIAVPEGARIVDATGKLVIPGGIDPHTHCQLPFMGTVAADDFDIGTQAAVAGGTTMLSAFFF